MDSEIQNPGLWISESRKQLESGIQVSQTRNLASSNWNQEFTVWNPESKTVLDYFTCNVVWFVSITLIFFFFWGGGIIVMVQDHPHDYYGNKPTKIYKVVYHLHGVDKPVSSWNAKRQVVSTNQDW